MTPDELLKDLRDIQLPEADPLVNAADVSLTPYLVLAILLAGIVLVRFMRSRSWLRQARRNLGEINRENPDNAQALLDLAAKIAVYRRVTPLPEAAFLPQKSIGAQEVKLLHDHLLRVLAK